MGCGCKKKHGTLTCVTCGSTLHISYKERYEPLQAAKMQGKKCKQCYGTEFTFKENT